MELNIISKDGNIIRDNYVVDVKAGRIKSIKGDFKVRVEVIREILHNAIDANAKNIEIIVEYIDLKKVKLIIKYSGKELKVFKNIYDILDSLLKADISEKRKDNFTIGGKGIGSKIIFSAGSLEIKSTSNGEYNIVKIKEASDQIERIYDEKQQKLNVIVAEGKDIYNHEKKEIEFILDELFTDDIMSFEHEALIQYLNYFTVLGPISCEKIKEKNINILVKGLRLKDNKFTTENEFEEMPKENRFDYIKNYGICKKSKFHYLKCIDGLIETDKSLEKCIMNNEKKRLEEFSKKAPLYIFRAQGDIKNIINVRKKSPKDSVKDEDFFGVYVATEGVILNERLDRLPFKNAGRKSGGNLFSQYFGYVYNSNLASTGNRNNAEANEEYFRFRQELDEVMPIINKILSFDYIDNDKLIKINLADDNIIQGLWGELRFIYENPSMIEFWGKNQRHDFEYNMNFTEIKTKVSGNDENMIRINTVEELDDDIEGELNIYYLKKYSHHLKKGLNIFEQVTEVIKKIPPDKVDKLFRNIENYLNNEEFKFYYYDILENTNKYDLDDLSRYCLIKHEVYKVDKNFPRITRDVLKKTCCILPNGYDLNLAEVRSSGIKPIERNLV